MDDIIWMNLSELARAKGVTPQAMRERVMRLAPSHAGLIRRKGRSVLVDVAMFEVVVGEDGDAQRETAFETRRLMADDLDDDSPIIQTNTAKGYRDAQTDRARIDVRIKALELAKLQGKVVAIDGRHGVNDAMRQIAEKVARRIEMLPRSAQQMFEEGLVTDQVAARVFLRALTDEIRRKIAADMRAMAKDGKRARPAELSIDVREDEVAQ